MMPEQDNFETLKRLLKLKRYEQPPPRYFNDFSQQVIAHIKAGAPQGEESILDRLSWQVPWLRQLFEAFQTKPALAVGFGGAVCALLVGGVIYSQNLQVNPAQPMVLAPAPENMAKLQTPTNAPLGFGLREPSEVATAGSDTNNSLNPVMRSLFDPPLLNAEPVRYQLPSGN